MHVSRVVAVLVGLVLLAVTAVAAVIGFSYDARQDRNERTDVRRVALRSLMSELDGLVATTHQVSALFEASNGVSKAEFSTFTRPMLRDGSASTFAWVQHVDGADRARFEHASGHTIKQLTPDGRVVAAGVRASYDASRYVEQATPTPTPLGVDAAADPARRRALRAAATLNEPQATAVSRLVGSNVPGILVYAPVWSARRRVPRLGRRRVQAPRARPRDDRHAPGRHRVRAAPGHDPRRRARPSRPGRRQLDRRHRRAAVDLRTSPPARSHLSWGVIALIVGGLLSALVSVSLSRLAREAGRAERKASQSEERFANAFDHAPVGMALLDRDCRHVRVNDALAAMLGRTREEMTGLPAARIMPPDEAAACRALVAALIRGDQTSFSGDTNLLAADGRRLRVAVHMTLVDGTGEGDAPVLVHAVDVTEQRLAERRMRHLVDHDPLTGLLNRRGLAAAMQTQVAQSRRYGTAGALLVLDLDGFKAINDTLGHDAGDKLLVRVADELRACLRETDVLARLGGDEFAVILPRETLDEAAVVAGKITARLRATGEAVTASVGVAPFSAEHESGDDVMRAADLAMYSAKAAGRDRHAVAGRHPDLV